MLRFVSLAVFAFIFLVTGVSGTMNSGIKEESDTYVESTIGTSDSIVKVETLDAIVKPTRDSKVAAFLESIDEKITGNDDDDGFVVKLRDKIYNRCSECHVLFRFDWQYVEHCEKIHGNVRPYACNLCDSTFRIKYGLTSHERKVHFKGKKQPANNSSYPLIRKNTPVFCRICQVHFPGYKAFEQHALTAHEGVKMMACPHCPKKYGRRRVMVEHIRLRHNSHPSLKCNFCQNIFHRSDSLQKHEMDCEQRQMEKLKGNTVLLYKGSKWGKIRCDECGECDFKSFAIMRDHYKRRHPSVKLHPCDYCEEEFGNRITLGRHLDMTHADKREDIKVWKKYRKGCVYACAHCDGKLFRGIKAYEKHGLEEHKGKPMWFCQECRKGFERRGSVRNHALNVHNNDRHHRRREDGTKNNKNNNAPPADSSRFINRKRRVRREKKRSNEARLNPAVSRHFERESHSAPKTEESFVKTELDKG